MRRSAFTFSCNIVKQRLRRGPKEETALTLHELALLTVQIVAIF